MYNRILFHIYGARPAVASRHFFFVLQKYGWLGADKVPIAKILYKNALIGIIVKVLTEFDLLEGN